MPKKWYAVHTYASQEGRIKDVIEKGVVGTPLEEMIGQVLIPEQTTYLIREGKKIERKRKVFNSYVFIEAELTPEVISYIRNIPGVTNILGNGKDASPLDSKEVDRLLGIEHRDTTSGPTTDFLPGDIVKITAGPFSDFQGVVKHSSPDSPKITVDVTVFGRVTPVEVNVDQVELDKKK